MKGRVLVIAGSDSGGGAGLQADLRAIMALGGYATCAVTAVTAQDTQGVHGVVAMPPAFVARQMRCVLDDIGADAFKTGMLGDAATVAAVAEVFAAYPGTPFVLDPVMLAKGGAALLATDAVAMVARVLMPLCSVVTPNVPEAEALSGIKIDSLAEMHHAAEALLTMGVPAVLLKGGHLAGETVTDVLATVEGVRVFSAKRVETRHTHGTGCTLASAVAAGLAQGMGLEDAVARAHRYVQAAIGAAPGFGHGHGPLGHGVWMEAFA